MKVTDDNSLFPGGLSSEIDIAVTVQNKNDFPLVNCDDAGNGFYFLDRNDDETYDGVVLTVCKSISVDEHTNEGSAVFTFMGDGVDADSVITFELIDSFSFYETSIVASSLFDLTASGVLTVKVCRSRCCMESVLHEVFS